MLVNNYIIFTWPALSNSIDGSVAFLWLVKWIKLLFEFVPSCCFQWMPQQALHALIDLIECSSLVVLMHKLAACRQTWSYLTLSTRAVLICISQKWSTFQVPLSASQPTIHASLCVSASLIIYCHSHNDTINLLNVTIQTCSGSFVRNRFRHCLCFGMSRSIFLLLLQLLAFKSSF